MVAVEHQHRAHAPARQRGARPRRDQRIELRGPPRPEAGEPGAAREFREAGPEGGQGQFTDGHCSCLCRQPRRRQRAGRRRRDLVEPRQRDERAAHVAGGIHHGFAGEGYTIGHRRHSADAPHGTRAGGEALRRRERRHRLVRLQRVGALREEGVDRFRRGIGQRQQHVARRRRRIDARLARMHGQAVRHARVDRGRDAHHARQLGDGFERRVGGLVLEAGRAVVGLLRAVGALQVVRVAPVLDRVGDVRGQVRVRAADVDEETAQQHFVRGVEVDLRGLVRARSRRARCRRPSTCATRRRASTCPACSARDSSNTVRSIAPSAAARACASEIMLRAASASLRIENAKPLAITVSMTVSHSARMSAMPRWRRGWRIARDGAGRASVVMPPRNAGGRRPSRGSRLPAPRAARSTSVGHGGPFSGVTSTRMRCGSSCASSHWSRHVGASSTPASLSTP